MNKVNLHLHLDELAAFFQALALGEKRFPGILNSKVLLTTDVPDKTEAQWIREHTLCLGVGDSRFNEHRNGRAARLENSSSAKLMLEFLQVKDSAVANVVDEVNKYDNKAGCALSHLATIMKVARHDIYSTEPASGQTKKDHQKERESNELQLFYWAFDIFQTVVHKLHGGLKEEKGEIPFLQFVESLVAKSDFFSDETARERMMIDLRTTCESPKGKELLGIQHIYQSLWRKSEKQTPEEKAEDVAGQIVYFLQLLYKDQAYFLDYEREMKAEMLKSDNNIWFRIPVARSGSQGTLWAAMVTSDFRQAHKVLRYLGAHITVVKNSAGNVSIQTHQTYVAKHAWLKSPMRHGFEDLCAMLRFSETPQSQRKSLSWKILQGYGNCPGQKTWFFDEKGRMQILNGSHSHTVKPTRLTMTMIKSCLTSAFSIPHLRSWQERYHVPKDQLAAALEAHERVYRFGDLERAFDAGIAFSE